jgi:PilZ domain-containing protein
MSNSTPEPIVESDHDFFEHSGPLPTIANDSRRFPRFYFRSCAEAVIHPLRGEEDATPTQCFLLTRDLSRGGVGLVHCKQLFPGQRIDLTLNGAALRPVEVVWCRRWTRSRYIIGCRFVATSE